MTNSTLSGGRGRVRKIKGTRKNISSSSNFKEQIVKNFLQFLITVKLYHWNTTSYAKHKATDQFLDKFNNNIDKFVEVFIGRYKIKPVLSNIKLDETYLTDIGIIDLFNQFREFLNTKTNKK